MQKRPFKRKNALKRKKIKKELAAKTPVLTTANTRLELEPHQVILRPLVTEKGVREAEEANAYAFEIHRLATKLDVRRAVEELFNVRVDSVRIQNRKGKARRTRFRMGRTKDWKKAVVKLHEDSRIDFF